MTIAQLIRDRLSELGGNQQSAAARQIGVTRQTLINWMHGAYVPDPWPEEQVRRLAEWLDEPYPLILAMIFREKGINPDILPEVATAVAKKPFNVLSLAAYSHLGVAA